jgi:hypothetical protein
VVISYAASNTLIKRIEQGAPADIFFSADLDWMDYGEQKDLIKPDTRLNESTPDLRRRAGRAKYVLLSSQPPVAEYLSKRIGGDNTATFGWMNG